MASRPRHPAYKLSHIALRFRVRQNQRDTIGRMNGVKPVESPTPTGCRRRNPSGIIITNSEFFRQLWEWFSHRRDMESGDAPYWTLVTQLGVFHWSLVTHPNI